MLTSGDSGGHIANFTRSTKYYGYDHEKWLCPLVGDVGEAFLVLYDSMSAERRLQLLLGGRCDATVDGIVRWMVDKAFKNFLVACWKLREELIGVVGRVVVPVASFFGRGWAAGDWGYVAGVLECAEVGGV